MKLRKIFWVLVMLASAFSGCDKISNPLLPKQSTSSLPDTPPTYVDSSSNYTVYKILLEDCTAHKCPNCPPAEAEAEALLADPTIGPHLVFIEDNAGPGSLSGTTPVTGYPANAFGRYYVGEADSNWTTLFGILGVGLPFGMVDRIGYPNNMDYLSSNWQTTVQTLISSNPSPALWIDIHDSCWVPQRILGAEFKIHFNQTLPGSYLLVTGIVEDSIIDWQLDNSTLYGADSLYNHHFVLRGTFDLIGTGIGIPSAKTIADSTWTSFQTYDFTAGEHGKAIGWKISNCYIVAFVYNSPDNTTTPYQVVQTEMIKVQ